jgi:hypothetical protein
MDAALPVVWPPNARGAVAQSAAIDLALPMRRTGRNKKALNFLRDA